MITVTEAAQEKITDILAEENNPALKLRMFVQGGGCSGFSYGFSLDADKNEDDFEIPINSTSVLIDVMSMQYVSGATIKKNLWAVNLSSKTPMLNQPAGAEVALVRGSSDLVLIDKYIIRIKSWQFQDNRL